MKLIYHEEGDSAAVLTAGEIGPDDTADVRELDCDRIVRYDAAGRAIEYQFFNVRRHGVRLDDLESADDRAALAQLFREAGFQRAHLGDANHLQGGAATARHRRRLMSARVCHSRPADAGGRRPQLGSASRSARDGATVPLTSSSSARCPRC